MQGVLSFERPNRDVGRCDIGQVNPERLQFRHDLLRFRPIFLTSITTFAGLIPLMFWPAPEMAFFVPMAISLAWGVVAATTITLFLVPCLYLIAEDFFTWHGIKDREEIVEDTVRYRNEGEVNLS